MLAISTHALRTATPALASRKVVRSAALIGALLLTAVAVNVFIVAADLRARAVSQASEIGAVVCQTGDRAQLPHHPFRGALAPYATCTPHG